MVKVEKAYVIHNCECELSMWLLLQQFGRCDRYDKPVLLARARLVEGVKPEQRDTLRSVQLRIADIYNYYV